jgi:hypothetical protein
MPGAASNRIRVDIERPFPHEFLLRLGRRGKYRGCEFLEPGDGGTVFHSLKVFGLR